MITLLLMFISALACIPLGILDAPFWMFLMVGVLVGVAFNLGRYEGKYNE